jgi:predicted MFS family arabinose efflux permease
LIRSTLRLYRDSFSGLPRPVWYLALGLLANRAGTMVLPFLSLYLVEETGMSTSRAGVVMLCFGLGSVAGSFLGGKLSDRFSAVRVQEASLAVSGAGFLAISQVRSFELMAAGMFVLSTVSEAFRPACLTATLRHCPEEMHVRALALIRLAANLGMAIGPAVGGLLAGIDYVWLFVGDGLTCWLAAVLLLATLRPTERAGAASGSRETEDGTAAPRGVDGRFLMLLAITFALAFVFFQMFSTVPLYLNRDYGLSERRIGLLFSLNGGLITLFEMVLVRVLERRNPAAIMGWGALMICTAFATFPLGTGFTFAALVFVVVTAGEMLALPFGNGLAARLAMERGGGRHTGAYMGWYSMTFSVAFIIAPFTGLTVIEALGPRALWSGIGAVGPLALLLSASLARRIPSRPASR